MPNVLITGGAGFVGSHFIRHALRAHADWHILNLDKLTYAGNLDNLRDVESDPRYRFERGDIADPAAVDAAMAGGVDLLVNFAAETHVDRSFVDPAPFVETNAKGTFVLLEAARRHGVRRMVHLSTPEVYGGSSPLKPGERFVEDAPFLPNNPYSASKAAADLMCRAFHRSYGVPVMLTRFANAFGSFQYPEKLLPVIITRALRDRPVPVYGDGQYRRNWIHTDDICRAIDLILEGGRPGQAYNIGTEWEMSNLDFVHRVLDIVGKPRSLVTFVPDRPSHDWQYPLDSTRIETELGWRPAVDFDAALAATVDWYRDHRGWWERAEAVDYGARYADLASARKGPAA